MTNHTGLLAHLCVAEAAQDVSLLEVATFWTRLDVGLAEVDRERHTVKTVGQDNTNIRSEFIIFSYGGIRIDQNRYSFIL